MKKRPQEEPIGQNQEVNDLQLTFISDGRFYLEVRSGSQYFEVCEDVLGKDHDVIGSLKRNEYNQALEVYWMIERLAKSGMNLVGIQRALVATVTDTQEENGDDFTMTVEK